MKRLIIVTLFSLTALFLVACGGGEAAQPDASGNITITMADFTFTPDNINLKVGQEVTIMLVNQGEKDHELMFGRNIMVMGGQTTGFEHDLFEEMAPMVMRGGMGMDDGGEDDHGEAGMGAEGMAGMEGDHAGFMVLIPDGGEDATLTFTVTEDMVGEWELGCFQGNGSHYDDGMQGKLVVSR